MKAAVIDGYGGSDKIEVRDVPDPGPPGPGQVLVQVRATSVNPVDWKIRRGSLRLVMPASFPLILGFDAAGEVVEIGPEVTRFQPGDSVFGAIDTRRTGGAYAELALAHESALASLPASLSIEEAAALPLAGLTALQALRDQGELVSGEKVAINGGSGGVGHLAVQIARAMGAHVTAVASGRNQQFLRDLGAHETIDYEEDYVDSGDDFWDVLFDAVGVLSFREAEPSLSDDGGIYVTTNAGPAAFAWSALTSIRSLVGPKKRARAVMVKYKSEDLLHLGRLADQGRVRPEIQEVFPLEKIRQAHDLSQRGEVRGKLVVRLD